MLGEGGGGAGNADPKYWRVIVFEEAGHILVLNGMYREVCVCI